MNPYIGYVRVKYYNYCRKNSSCLKNIREIIKIKRYKLLQEKRENIIKIARKHGAFNILIFGSVARGEDSNDSNIDFLVEMEQGRNLLDRIGLIQDLEDYLGCKVDVATINSLRDCFRERIMKEVIPL